MAAGSTALRARGKCRNRAVLAKSDRRFYEESGGEEMMTITMRGVTAVGNRGLRTTVCCHATEQQATLEACAARRHLPLRRSWHRNAAHDRKHRVPTKAALP